MNPYQKAYSVFRLEPGASKESIQRRYKRLIMVWHPDRFQSKAEKDDAEEELKIINNAKDLLWKHFDSPSHKPSGCECQQPIGAEYKQQQRDPQPGPQGNTNPGPGPGPGRKKSTAEEEALKRDAERKARAAAEEAARQAGQQRQTQQRAYEDAQKQQVTIDQEKIRWKIAQGQAAVFVVLSLFGWIGSGIGDGIRHAASTINNQINNTTPTENKDDPCALVGPQTSPPAVILPTLIEGIKDKVSLWDIKCYGTGSGASVHGRDSQNRDVVWQEYGPNWVLDHQDIVKAQGNEITVERYKMPGDYQGRCVYRYDDGSLVEANEVDSQQNPVISLTVERRRNGKPSVIVKPAGGNTTTYYDLSGTDAKSRFYLGERYMQIKDYIEPSTALTSPDSLPLPGPDRGTTGTNPFSTNTSTDTQTNDNGGHLSPSPFGTSPPSSPGMDKLLEQLKK